MSLSLSVEQKILDEIRMLRAWHQEQARVHRMYANGKGLSQRYIDTELEVAEFHEQAAITLFSFQVQGDADS